MYLFGYNMWCAGATHLDAILNMAVKACDGNTAEWSQKLEVVSTLSQWSA